MLGFAVLLIGIAVALWVSFWLLVALFILGVVMVIWTHLREFLVRKGILNPRFSAKGDAGKGMHEADEAPSLTIEGDYKRVDSE